MVHICGRGSVQVTKSASAGSSCVPGVIAAQPVTAQSSATIPTHADPFDDVPLSVRAMADDLL
jgi:hypothetical protein